MRTSLETKGSFNVYLAGCSTASRAGRKNKVAREEHIGMPAAVETWVEMDHKREMQYWVDWLENIRGY